MLGCKTLVKKNSDYDECLKPSEKQDETFMTKNSGCIITGILWSFEIFKASEFGLNCLFGE